MYYLSSKPLSNQLALMINSYLVIKKNNVLLHYKNEFDIQPIKVITPSFPFGGGRGRSKKEPPMPNIIPYNPKLREFARYLRNNSTLSEVLLWKEIKNKALGVEFKRQVPILDYIVDF